MKAQITLDAQEVDTINRTIEILEEYSRIFSAAVKNKRGFYHDHAASAVNMLKSVLKEQENETEPAEE